MRGILLTCALLAHGEAFIVQASTRCTNARKKSSVTMNFLTNFLRELDNFADDAMGRRLGNGSKFYGKRKSSFYGMHFSEAGLALDRPQ